MKILWWENGKIRPSQLLKGLKYLWKYVNMNPVWRKACVSRMWHLKAMPSSGWEQLPMPMALGSLCSFSCRWDFASSRHCEIVLVLCVLVWTPVQHGQQGSLSSPCYSWRLIFFPKIILAPGVPTKVQHAQGPNRWHSSDHRQVSAQPLSPYEPAPGSSSHQGRETGFLRASLIQYLHLTDGTSPTWQHRSRHLPYRHLQLDQLSPDYLSTTGLAFPHPFSWKTTGTPDNQSRSRRGSQALPIIFTHCDIWDISTMSCFPSKFFSFSMELKWGLKPCNSTDIGTTACI